MATAPAPLSDAAAGAGGVAGLDAASLRALLPAAYLSGLLARGVRPDGRAAAAGADARAARHAACAGGSLGGVDGSATATVGGTVAIAGVRLARAHRGGAHARGEAAPAGLPLMGERPAPWGHHGGTAAEGAQGDTGAVQASVSVAATCGLEPRARAQLAAEATAMVEQVLGGDACVALGGGEGGEGGLDGWRVRVDVVLASLDGGAFECALLAAVGALKDARVPSLEGGEEATVPLPLASVPLALGFALHAESGQVLTDPDLFEEGLAGLRVRVVVDAASSDGDVLALDVTGGTGATGDMLRQCVSAAKQRAQELASSALS